MSAVSRGGVFVLSVDVGWAFGGPDQRAHSRVDEAATSLVNWLTACDVGATWAIADPAGSAFADRVAQAGPRHEVAILADRSWAGPEAPRSRFAAELARRVLGARSAGFAPDTLALRDCCLAGHLDLLVKQGIRAVRTAPGGMRGAPASQAAPAGAADWIRRAWRSGPVLAQVQVLRWGLWQFGGSLDLPGVRARRAQRAMDRAVAQEGIVHLVIDLARLAGGAAGFKVLDRVLRHAVLRRDQGLLEALTVAGAVARLCRPRHVTPARSILRPLAA